MIGYTNEVYRYMQEADVVISKPGGITLFETIHAGTPLLYLNRFSSRRSTTQALSWAAVSE